MSQNGERQWVVYEMQEVTQVVIFEHLVLANSREGAIRQVKQGTGTIVNQQPYGDDKEYGKSGFAVREAGHDDYIAAIDEAWRDFNEADQ